MLLHLLLMLKLMTSCSSVTRLNGAGASFPGDVYAVWLPAYRAHRSQFVNVEMTYESIGSGGGQRRIRDEEGDPIEYAGSDSLLSEEDFLSHPDLQMFPSMAGAVVLAFNLPTVTELNLTMETVAGMYNGSINRWDDAAIVSTNPHASLPRAEIRAVARKDKSGTTEIFTRALSSASIRWEQTYGVFSQGINESGIPEKWNSSAVKLFGQTNRGVSGLILSDEHTIGYLVLSDAVNAKVTVAKIRNGAGNVLAASVETVQNAMKDFASDFSDKMIASLAGPPGRFSYPLSGYTYLIIRKTTMTNCDSAVELARYIQWFFTNPIAQSECENVHMVPLPENVYSQILNDIVKEMQCSGRNVFDLLETQILNEELSTQSWRIPVAVTSSAIAVLVVIILCFLFKPHILQYRSALRNEWLIFAEEVARSDSTCLESQVIPVSLESSKHNKVFPSVRVVPNKSLGASRDYSIGQWNGKRFQSTKLSFVSCFTTIPLATKRHLLWMRQEVQFKNITAFYGLTSQESSYFAAHEFCSKGSLYTFLRNKKLNLSNNMKYIMCLEISRGMSYLHKLGLRHGCLNSKCCYLDENWVVKVADWYLHCFASHLKTNVIHKDVLNANQWEMPEFWTAPEILRYDTAPNERSDVYSFAIVMQEIFSRDAPFHEHIWVHTPNDVLQALISTSLRPAFVPDTPDTAREVMNRSWEMDPFARPSFTNIHNMIANACLTQKTLMDCMIFTLEEYVATLEEKLNAKNCTN